MATPPDDPVRWAVLPGSILVGRLIAAAPGQSPWLEFSGNRPGLLSLGIFLLWMHNDSANAGLTITGLPFVAVEGALSLRVVDESGENQESVRRTDKDRQFEWLVTEDRLQMGALSILDLAFAPDGYHPGYYDPSLTSGSDAQLVFRRST